MGDVDNLNCFNLLIRSENRLHMSEVVGPTHGKWFFWGRKGAFLNNNAHEGSLEAPDVTCLSRTYEIISS